MDKLSKLETILEACIEEKNSILKRKDQLKGYDIPKSENFKVRVEVSCLNTALDYCEETIENIKKYKKKNEWIEMVRKNENSCR